jgi:hypothetical protein
MNVYGEPLRADNEKVSLLNYFIIILNSKNLMLVMGEKIDTPEKFQQLKKEDVLFCPKRKESYLIDEIYKELIVLRQEDMPRALRSVLYAELISDKWELL